MTVRYIFFRMISVMLLLPFFVFPALAQEPETEVEGGSGSGTFEIKNPLESDNFLELLDAIILALLKIAGPIAVIMVIYAGFLYTTSGGKPEQVKKANKTILYAVIGLIVLIVSKGIVSLVVSILNGG